MPGRINRGKEGSNMATSILETFGIVRPDGTVELDRKVTCPPGKVKLRVEYLEPPSLAAETLLEFVDRTRRELAAEGHEFMNDEEVTTWIEELRADDDRVEDIYRHAE